MNLVITGGGTGGHIFAGVAIAQEFTSQSRANQVLFIGSESGLETRLVPKAGFKLETLRLGKLVGQTLVHRIATLIQIPIAVLKCIRVLRKFKADMVIGVGGYAAGPCILAARVLRIPTGILEQNAIMGFTNRISAKLSQQVFVAFDPPPPGVAPSKCVLTGNPARNELKPSAAKSVKPFTIFAFGGSQGAKGINRLMREAAKELLAHKNEIQIIHQTGEREFQSVLNAYREIGFPAEVYNFIDDMQSMYNKASVVVCRAGSSTVAELGATKNAAIFIPFPFSAGNHQEHNARLVHQAEAGELLLEQTSSGKDLARLILGLKSHPEKLEKMRQNIARFYKPDAAKRIVEVMKIRSLGLG